jgi:radical SAM superfamily enzyme YgiQ (UPF0313 family)
MKVLFIQDNGINESLALCELSALLKAHGHETAVLLEREERDLEAAIDAFVPDWFLIPCSILAHTWALGMARRIKARYPGKPVILGGTHPTFYPEIVEEPDADAIIVGEAEGAALDICEAMARGDDIADIPNVWLKRNGQLIQNHKRPLLAPLDDIPLPDRGMYFRYPFLRSFGWKKFMSGRGCYHSCAYCYNPKIRESYHGLGVYVRRKTPERAVREVLWMKQNSSLKIAHFSDDLFISDADWAEEFSACYRREVGDIPFTCNATVDLVTERSVAALARAGCRAVAIGIETGDEHLRRMIMKKNITDEQIRAAARLLKKHGIMVVTFNMIGNPGESLESAFRTMELNAEIGADCARLTFGIPLPRTRYADYAVEIGVLDPAHAECLPDITDIAAAGPHPVFKTPHKREFINLYYLFRLGVARPALIPLIKKAVRSPATAPFKPFSLNMFLVEKRMFNLGLAEGFRYFLHVGSPDRRTTNFVFLI